MNCSNDIREVALEFVDVGDGLVNIFPNFIKDLFELVVVDGEIVFENSDSFLARFSEDDSNLINEVDFGDKHSGKEGTNQSPVLKVSIQLDSVQ